MIDFKRAFKTLYQNKEICYIIDNNKLSDKFNISLETDKRAACRYDFSEYPDRLVHTHPIASKPYPSMEDIIKLLKHPNIHESYIVTGIGVWNIMMEGHESIWTSLSEGDKRQLKKEIEEIGHKLAYPYLKRGMADSITDDTSLLGKIEYYCDAVTKKINQYINKESKSKSKSKSKSRSRSTSKIVIDIFLDDTINLSNYDKGSLRKKSKKKQTKRRKMKLPVSEKKYKQLISQRRSKKKMTSKDKKLLDNALYVKYCKCLKKFEFIKKDKQLVKGRGYPICMNSIYKNRHIKPPKNASRRCSLTFNKNVGK